MTEALKNTISDIYHNILAYLSGITMMDVLDVLLVTAVVYFAIQLLRKSNAFNVLKGLLLLLVLLWVSEIFQLHVLSFLIDSTLKVAVLAFIIIFQPELRRMLGQVTHLAGMISRPDVPDMESEISQTVEACRSMSRDRTLRRLTRADGQPKAPVRIVHLGLGNDYKRIAEKHLLS